jgi:predicted DNA-binding transcriptional regulator YafY
MVFADGLTKAHRLVELQFLFWARCGRALSCAEIAHALGVAPRTARKYLVELSVSGRLPVISERRRWRLADGARLEVLPVRFQLEEAAALFLAARLLITEADEPNRAVHDALARLACVMPPEVRGAFGTLADRSPLSDGRLAPVFRAFAYGWALRRLVHVEYEPRSHPGQTSTCDFAPYMLEAVPASRALYAIGHAEPPGEMRVLKLERVRAAELTTRSFTARDLDSLLERLSTSWGIWLADTAPVEVVLRFGPAVATRVRESRWHPSQHLADRPDGSVEMTLQVASTVELLPWVLGWGGNCQVLAPPDLASTVAGEHRAAAASYDARPNPKANGP